MILLYGKYSPVAPTRYGVCNSHYLTFMTALIRDRKGIGSGTYMGFMGVIERKGFCLIGLRCIINRVQYNSSNNIRW